MDDRQVSTPGRTAGRRRAAWRGLLGLLGVVGLMAGAPAPARAADSPAEPLTIAPAAEPLTIAPAAEPLTIAIVSRTVFYVPAWIAARDGYFRAEGLAATIEVFDNAEKINEGLRQGRIQIAISTPESVLVDVAHGGSLRIIAGNAGKLPHFIIARPTIQTLAQLKGARFGVLSMQEGTTYLVREIAAAAGLGAGDYSVAAVGGAPTRQRLLMEGKIDVGLQPFPLSYEAEAAGFTNLGALAALVPDWQFTSVNVDQGWAQPHRRAVVAALRALRRGQDSLAARPDAAVAIAAEELRTSPALAKRALDDTHRLGILDPKLDVTPAGIARVYGALQAAGLIDAAAPFDIAASVDGSYLRQSREAPARP